MVHGDDVAHVRRGPAAVALQRAPHRRRERLLPRHGLAQQKRREHRVRITSVRSEPLPSSASASSAAPSSPNALPARSSTDSAAPHAILLAQMCFVFLCCVSARVHAVHAYGLKEETMFIMSRAGFEPASLFSTAVFSFQLSINLSEKFFNNILYYLNFRP